jgi:high affinity sulfate transporter 1
MKAPSLTAVVPGLPQFLGYHRRWLRGDVLAGITVAAYLIPQVMAYATVAGLPPVTGLWACLGPLLVYAVLGSSRQLSVGPQSTTSMMTLAVLAPIAAGNPGKYAVLAAAVAVLVGIICLAARLARLAMLADLLSRPVLVGYMTGVAVVMIAGQLGTVMGAPVSGDSFAALVRSAATQLDHIHVPTAVLALSVLAGLLIVARIAPRAPAPLFAMLAGTAVVVLFSLNADGVNVVGEIPAGLPAFGLAGVSVDDLSALLLPAVGIAVVAFSDNVLTARTFAARHGQTVDPSSELSALGVCNITAGLSQGFPVCSSSSRTAVAASSGARTQLHSLVVLACVVLVLLGANGLLAHFPTAALGALVVYAALRLIDFSEYRRLATFRRSELILALLTVAAVLWLGVLYGVLFAIAMSILDLLRRVARPSACVLGFVPGMPGMHNLNDYPHAATEPGLLVFRYDAPLCFANAEDFRKRALAAVDDNTGWFLLNAEANVEVDLTALDAMAQLSEDLRKRGIVFALARVKPDVRAMLVEAGVVDDEHVYMTLPTAVEAYRSACVGAAHGPCADTGGSHAGHGHQGGEPGEHRGQAPVGGGPAGQDGRDGHGGVGTQVERRHRLAALTGRHHFGQVPQGSTEAEAEGGAQQGGRDEHQRPGVQAQNGDRHHQ